MDEANLVRACNWIAHADAMLVCAGAGMGADSGLPVFRGNGGFWENYPALGTAQIAFEDIASPDAFARWSRLAWGFYGHRLQLYRNTVPHAGFHILRRIAAQLAQGCFVFTSNVDGQFQRAGFDPERICECHGSIHYLQCTQPCSTVIWPADDFLPEIDTAACRLTSPLPRCEGCGAVARPNVLMFGDGDWIAARTRVQQLRLEAWLKKVSRLVVIELGAGTHVPTVRWLAESLEQPLIRINLGEAQVPKGEAVSLPLRALAGLRLLEAALTHEGFLAPEC